MKTLDDIKIKQGRKACLVMAQERQRRGVHNFQGADIINSIVEGSIGKQHCGGMYMV